MSETLDARLTDLRQTMNAGRLRKKAKSELLDSGDLLCHPQAYTFFGRHEFPALRERVVAPGLLALQVPLAAPCPPGP